MKLLKRWMTEHPKLAKYLLILSFLLGVFFVPSESYAQTQVSVPIEQEFQILSGSLNSQEQEGVYLLEPIEEGNPMPTDGNTYQVRLSGNAHSDVGVFNFSHAGTFSYKLYQQIPANRKGFDYDDEIYTIVIYVSASGEAEVIVTNSQKMKTASLSFVNTYRENSVAEESEAKLVADTSQFHSTSANASQASLPKTGQAKEAGWIEGTILLAFAFVIYRWKRRAYQNK